MGIVAQLVLPVIVPRAFVLWGLIRLVLAVLILAGADTTGALSPSPVGVVFLTAVTGALDVRIRGERILWANLAVRPAVLTSFYAIPAGAAEALLMIIR